MHTSKMPSDDPVIERKRGHARRDHERGIMAGLLLEAAVAMVPVGAVLLDRNLVCESFAAGEPRKTKSGNAVHMWMSPDSVPINRGRHLERIGDRYRYRVALA